MLVRDWMSPDPVTVRGDTTVQETRRLLDYYGIRHLLVVDAGRLVGVVSDRDVRITDSALRKALRNATVSKLVDDRRPTETIMSSPAHIIDIDEPVEAAARLMLSRRISALPVVESGNRLCGIITSTDCLLASLSQPVGVEGEQTQS